MANIALIGHTGNVGAYLKEHINFNRYYNRDNIISIINEEFDILVCAAPTGDTELINNSKNDTLGQLPAYSQEFEMILFLLDHVRKSKIKKFFYASSQYVADNPNTKYSVNRRFIESWAEQNVPNSYICRKSTKEEVLEDLKKFINE